MATISNSQIRRAMILRALDKDTIPADPRLWTPAEKVRAAVVVSQVETAHQIQLAQRRREAIEASPC